MKFRKKKKKRKKSERFFFFFELKFIQIYSMIFKKKMAISHEDFRDVFLPSFSLSIFYQNTDGFETSPPRFQIPSDGWPYNLTSSYPFYVSTIVYQPHLYVFLSRKGKFRHYRTWWKVLVERCLDFRSIHATLIVQRRSTGRCMHFRYAYNGPPFWRPRQGEW